MPLQVQQLCLYCKKTFNWIDHHIDLFNPLRYERENNTSSLFQTKAFGELGLLCMLSHRCAVDYQEAEIERFLHMIYAVWQDAEYQERIVRRPAYFQLYALVYVVLQQCNMINDSSQEIIQQVIDQQFVTATETTAMRLLDRRHLLDCGKFAHALPSYEALYKHTLLAKEPPLVYLTDTDVYAITHTLFYLTDFGRRAAPMLDGDHLLTVRWIIETLLGLYLRRRHWDLVGELLIDCYCLHWYPDIVFTAAWEILMKNQLADGCIPGPRFSEDQLSHLQEPSRRQYYFEQNYHTTIVNAVASFLIYQDLQRGHSQNLER